MKFLTIGDIHGRSNWKTFTHNSYRQFENWLSNDNDIDMPFNKFDKVIFVGDYCDSFNISSIEILNNLKDIIEFKKLRKDKVILLLGNHDIQYFINNQICTGYRGELQHDLYDLFIKNIDLFEVAYEYNKHIWSHAGITRGWLEEIKKVMNSNVFKFSDFVKEDSPQSPVEWTKLAWKFNIPNFYNVDSSSGGTNKWASPIWVRPRMLNNFYLEGYNQIVGHTPQNKVVVTTNNSGGKHYYIDCLEHDKVLELNI